jgi:tripartite-type tricarboxylate transporter receptor subunit TctC
MLRRSLPATIASLLAVPGIARAQSWPSRTVRIIVPVAAGGSQDIVARLTARHLIDALGQSVVVENQPTAAGNVAFETVVRARPDGHLLLAGSDSLSINGALFPKLGFDPAADFEPVVQSVRAPLVMSVRADAPFADFAALLAAARRAPVAVGTNGNGTLGHLLGEVVQAAAETRWTHIPYRGGALAINDLLGGALQAIITYSGAVTDHIRAGRMRGLFISSASRNAIIPHVPSLPEAGYHSGEIVGWHGLVAPRGTDHAIIDRLNRETRRGFAQPELAQRLVALGLDAVDASPEALGDRIRADAIRWAGIIRASRIEPD